MSGAGRKPRRTKHNSGHCTEGQTWLKVLGHHSSNRQTQQASAGSAVSMRSTTGKGRDVPTKGRSPAARNPKGSEIQTTSSLRSRQSYDLPIPLLGIYPQEIKSLSRKDIYTPMCSAALFTIAKL